MSGNGKFLKKTALTAAAAVSVAARVFAIFLVLNFIFWNIVFLADRIPKTVATSESGEYEVLLQTLGSPGWPFGPQDGRVVLKRGGKTVCKKKFTLHNDGKNMTDRNWSVMWESAQVTVTLSGEEQPDEVLKLEFYEG